MGTDEGRRIEILPRRRRPTQPSTRPPAGDPVEPWETPGQIVTHDLHRRLDVAIDPRRSKGECGKHRRGHVLPALEDESGLGSAALELWQGMGRLPDRGLRRLDKEVVGQQPPTTRRRFLNFLEQNLESYVLSRLTHEHEVVGHRRSEVLESAEVEWQPSPLDEHISLIGIG